MSRSKSKLGCQSQTLLQKMVARVSEEGSATTTASVKGSSSSFTFALYKKKLP